MRILKTLLQWLFSLAAILLSTLSLISINVGSIGQLAIGPQHHQYQQVVQQQTQQAVINCVASQHSICDMREIITETRQDDFWNE